MKANKYLKDFIKYTLLNVLGMIGLSCYILADTFFISKGLGSKGLAALNISLPAYSLISGCGLMLGMGGATKYSVEKSKGKQDEANKVFYQCFDNSSALRGFVCFNRFVLFRLYC